MIDPNIQKVNNIPQVNDASDVAGGADVSSSYIVSDVQTAPDVNASVGIDSVAVSTGVATAQVSAGGAVEKEESSNYIQSDVETISLSDQFDGYDMNSLAEVSMADKYIDPTASGIQSILADLKANGTITSGMSEEEVVLAINNYVYRNYSYISDTGDTWSSVSETIKRGGGDCEDFANLAASLMIAALMDRGFSLEDASKKISCVVVANTDTGMGHVYVRYTGDDGSIKYLDPVSSRVTGSIDSSKTLLFSYSDESVTFIDKSFDYSRLDTATYTIEADNTLYLKVDPGEFETYFRAIWGMQESASAKNAIGIYMSLKNLIAAVNTKYGSWDNGLTTSADLNTINDFLTLLDGNSIQDYNATVAPFWASYEAILAKLGVSLDAYLSSVSTYVTALNTFIIDYCVNTDTYKGWKEGDVEKSGVSDCLIAVEYLTYGIDSLEDFKAAHPDLIIKTAAQGETPAVLYTDDEILDKVYFKNPYNGGKVCTVRQGLAAIDSYKAYITAFNQYKFMGTAYLGEARVKGYCDYSSSYIHTFTYTTNYMESMMSILGQAEYGVWLMNKDLVQIDSSVEVINADAAVDDAQTRLNTAKTAYDKLSQAQKDIAGFWISKGVTDLASLRTFWGASDPKYLTMSDGDLNGIQVMMNGNSCSVKDALAAIPTVSTYTSAATTLTDAQTALATARTNYKGFYHIASDAELDALLDDFKAKYMSQNADGWWQINLDASLFSEKIEQASLLKGFLVALSLIYEAKRDFRSLVQEELDGENYGLKGMAINTLFMKKVNKLDQYIQQTVVDILTTINTLNQAKYDEEVADINAEYDKKAADIQNDTPGFCENDNREEDTLKNENERMKKTDAVNQQYEDVKKSQLLVCKNMLAATGANITGNTSEEIWASINTEINNSLDNMDNFSRATLNTSDDSQYQEMDRNLVTSMRQRLVGVFGIQRTILMAKKAVSDMRNLAHQEMTGIGGRESKMDMVADMVTSDSNAVMTWFDEAVNDIETITRLGNQIRYNELQIEKNQKLIDKIESQKSKRLWSKILSGVAAVAGIVGAIVGGPVGIILALVAIAAGIVAAVLNASANKEVADERARLEDEYSSQVIKPTDPVFENQINSMSGLTDEQKIEILQNYDPNSTAFKNNLNNVDGLSAEQKNEILNMADPKRAAYMNSIDSNTTLTEAQKQALKDAYDPNEEIFKNNLANLNASTSPRWWEFWKDGDPGLGLSDSQITVIVDAYEGDSFKISVDSDTTLTDAQKEAIKNAYDPNKITFKANLDNISGLTQAQKNAILNAYNTRTSSNSNNTTYSSDNTINTAMNAENSTEDMFWNMNDSNYFTFMNDGQGFTGSSAFNTITFANTVEAIRNNNLILLIANSVRETMAEMRNLVHMEMTSIGGRAPSSMVTATMEAARGQSAFIANEMYMKLWDMNTANNMRFQRDQKLRLYNQIADAADLSFGLSFIPIVGGMISDFYSNYTTLQGQKDQLEAINNEKFNTDADLDEADFNALIDDGLVDTGNDTQGVDYQKISNARSSIAKKFIQGSVEATIRKTMRQLRSITHMEMTNIQSSTGGDFADQANMISFQTAMETVSLITQYLTQKAEIQNRVKEANKSIDKVNTQITNLEIGGAVSLVVGTLISIIMPGGFDSVMAALSTLQLAASAADFILGIFTTINAWVEAKFASQMAKDDMGEVGEYLQLKQISDSSVNSTTSRLEALEQKSIEEINANMMQDLGAGYIGVNKSLSAVYKTLISQLYKAERKKSEIQETLQALRNAVHEIMSGISGVSVDATTSVLNKKESEIKARIDDMFSKLEVAANRWNQITDAQRAAKKAEMQAITSTITTAIQGIIVAISLYASFKAEPAAIKKVETAQKTLSNAKTPDAKKLALKNYNTAKSELTALRSRISLYTTVALPASEILIKVALAFIERSEMKDVQSKREGEVAKASDKKAAITKDSKGVDGETREAVAEAGFDGYAANAQATSGQRELDDQAATYALKSEEIESDFKDNMYNVELETIEFAKGLAKELAKMWKNRKTEAYQRLETFGERLESINGLDKAQKDAINQAFTAKNVEEFSKQLESIKGLNEVQKGEIKEAYDKSKNVAALGTFAERLNSSASVGNLTPDQKSAVMAAASSSKNVKAFIEELNSSSQLQGVTSAQKNAIINAYEPKTEPFMENVDALLTINDDKKTAIKNAYDPDFKTFTSNLDAIVTNTQELTGTPKLTDTEKLSAMQAFDPKVETLIDNLNAIVTDTQKLTDQQKVAIMKMYDPNEVTFKKNIESMNTLTPAQIKDVLKAHITAMKENKEIDKLTITDKDDKTEILKKTKDQIDKANKLVNNIAAGAAGMPVQSTAVTTPNMAPQENQQSANSSNAMARLDNIINDFNKQMEALNSVTKTVDAQSTEKPDLKELLQRLQEQIKAVRKELASEKAILNGMRQKDVPEAQKIIAAQGEVVKKERDILVDDIKKVEERMKDLQKLAEDNPGGKKVIESQLKQLKHQLAKMMESYDKTKTKYEFAQAAASALNEEIDKHDKKVKDLGGEISKIQAAMIDIQKGITKSQKNGISAQTSMILGTGDVPPVKSTQYA